MHDETDPLLGTDGIVVSDNRFDIYAVCHPDGSPVNPSAKPIHGYYLKAKYHPSGHPDGYILSVYRIESMDRIASYTYTDTLSYGMIDRLSIHPYYRLGMWMIYLHLARTKRVPVYQYETQSEYDRLLSDIDIAIRSMKKKHISCKAVKKDRWSGV